MGHAQNRGPTIKMLDGWRKARWRDFDSGYLEGGGVALLRTNSRDAVFGNGRNLFP